MYPLFDEIVHSPTTLRAAEILCELASSPDSCGKQKHTNGAIDRKSVV